MSEETLEDKQPAADSIDLTQYKVKVDHFQGIHILKDEGFLEGAPNFRQVESSVQCDGEPADQIVSPPGGWLPYLRLCPAISGGI